MRRVSAKMLDVDGRTRKTSISTFGTAPSSVVAVGVERVGLAPSRVRGPREEAGMPWSAESCRSAPKPLQRHP